MSLPDLDPVLARPSAPAKGSRNTELLIGGWIVAIVAVVGILAPLIAPYNPLLPVGPPLQGPSEDHLFGTDRYGLDILSRLLYAPRVDLLIAGWGTLLAALIGVPLGAVSGYAPGAVGGLISRSLDIVQAFPFFILALFMLGIMGPSLPNIVLVLAVINAPIYARLMRSQTLMLKNRTFIDAARVSGCGSGIILFRHILPNSLGPILAQMSVTLGLSIIMIAGVSFVGAGVRTPTPEWGVMIGDGAGGMFTGQWWPVIFPGIALAVTVVAFALVANGVTRAMNPESRR
ncbi:MAG: ABC transporter permease [Nitrospira sp.]